MRDIDKIKSYANQLEALEIVKDWMHKSDKPNKNLIVWGILYHNLYLI